MGFFRRGFLYLLFSSPWQLLTHTFYILHSTFYILHSTFYILHFTTTTILMSSARIIHESLLEGKEHCCFRVRVERLATGAVRSSASGEPPRLNHEPQFSCIGETMSWLKQAVLARYLHPCCGDFDEAWGMGHGALGDHSAQ